MARARYDDNMTFDDLEGAYAEASDSFNTNPPDGEYVAKIYNLGFKWTSKNNERIFEIISEVLEGECAGMFITRTYLLRPKLLFWLKSDVKKLGFEFNSLAEIMEHLGSFLDIVCLWKIETKTDPETKKDRTDITILKVFSDADEGPATSGAEEPREDEKPSQPAAKPKRKTPF